LTLPVTCADIVEKAFRKEWAKAMEKKLSWCHDDHCSRRYVCAVFLVSLVFVLTVFFIYSSWVFREPVDPVALVVPPYFEVIPRKDARD
jgi:transcription initiation factor TFIID subunit 2